MAISVLVPSGLRATIRPRLSDVASPARHSPRPGGGPNPAFPGSRSRALPYRPAKPVQCPRRIVSGRTGRPVSTTAPRRSTSAPWRPGRRCRPHRQRLAEGGRYLRPRHLASRRAERGRREARRPQAVIRRRAIQCRHSARCEPAAANEQTSNVTRRMDKSRPRTVPQRATPKPGLGRWRPSPSPNTGRRDRGVERPVRGKPLTSSVKEAVLFRLI